MTYKEAVEAVRSYWGASLCVNHNDEKRFKEAVDVLEHRSWEPEEEERWVWHDAEFDPPKDDRFILLSFANAPGMYTIGCYKEDDGGGAYYNGDDDEPLIKIGLFVDGWWEQPKKPREEEDEDNRRR